jgi:hypothetical protein
MERNGFGPKTFQFETKPDGVTPLVHILDLPETSDFYRADDVGNDSQEMFYRILDGAIAVGIDAYASGEIWLLVCEQHLQHPDGWIRGEGLALGAGFGSGSDGGIAIVDSAKLSLLDVEGLRDNRFYDGLIIPEMGPFPLREVISFPQFEGFTISSVISSTAGAILHEIGHGLGLPHDWRNDLNFQGNLMFNGLRGFRSFVLPSEYPADETRLSYASALTLNSSRYFHSQTDYTEDDGPIISSLTAKQATVNGQLLIELAATDQSGLAAAMLIRGGNRIAEMELSGTSASVTFETPFYEPGAEETYRIIVYDIQGNRSEGAVTVTPDVPSNRAPEPFVLVSPALASLGSVMRLEASLSSDPDHDGSQLTVEWDLNGDGVFDTPPTTGKTLDVSFNNAGPRQIIARITDPAGAQSTSTPIGIRVTEQDTLGEHLIAVESFAYLPRSLGGLGSITDGWKGAWSGGQSVVSPGQQHGALVAEGNSSQTGTGSPAFRDLNLDVVSRQELEPWVEGGKLGRDFASIWISVLCDGENAAISSAWSGVSLFDNSQERLFIGKPWQQGEWGIDVTGEGIYVSGYPVHNKVFIVLHIDFLPGREWVRMWINPDLHVTPKPWEADIWAGMRDLNFNRIRVAGNTAVLYDELRIGTTFGAVVPLNSVPWVDFPVDNGNTDPDNSERPSLLEGFETGTFSDEWSSSGDKSWEVSEEDPHAGKYCARSGQIGDGETSGLKRTIEITEPGEITFWLKVSSESGWDKLIFYIDEVKQDEWSGQIDWTGVTFPVAPGTRTLEWIYEKDGSSSDGHDAAWIDDISSTLE